jgi:hypothetical protein
MIVNKKHIKDRKTNTFLPLAQEIEFLPKIVFWQKIEIWLKNHNAQL